MRNWYKKSLGIALAVMAPLAANAAAVYMETEWTDVLDAGGAVALPSSNAVSSFSLSNSGHPGGALQFTASVTAAAYSTNISSGMVFSPNTAHDGAAAPVQELSWSSDLFQTVVGTDTVNTQQAAFLILQEVGGVVRLFVNYAPPASSRLGIWQTIGNSGLEADDFSLLDLAAGVLDPGSHPDFSAPMFFGFGTGATFINDGNFAATATYTLVYDNFTVTVTPMATDDPDPNQVPVPATWMLMCGGLLAAGGARRTAKPSRP